MSVCRANEDVYHETDLPLPRFVSLEKGKTYVRAGPGEDYPIKWELHKEGLPVEIILEYDNWRKIRDKDGDEGWVFHSMLSGKRTGIVLGEGQVPVYREYLEGNNIQNAVKSAYFEPNLVVSIDECKDFMCHVEASGFSGWMERKSLWGVYALEIFD